MLTWGDLMAYPENPNGDEITLKLKHGGVYTTKAKNFMALMFEVIDSLNPDLQYVFNQFDYKVLLTQKNILSYAEFYKVCHANVVESSKSQRMDTVSTASAISELIMNTSPVIFSAMCIWT